MQDILKVAKFDASVQTPSGVQQFSATDTAGGFIVNREYKESFDKFKSGCTCGDSYIWRALSAVADETGQVLYDNIKNYIDYVTNVDLCKVQSLRSMAKMFGIEYGIFERLDLLPLEILELINIFSIDKKYLLYGDKILPEYRQLLQNENVIVNDEGDSGGYSPDQPSAVISDQVLDYDDIHGGRYYEFVRESFKHVLSADFLSMPYEKGGEPIYRIKGEYGIYDDIKARRDKYTQPYRQDSTEDVRRRYKMLHGVPLAFDESAALDRIEAGLESDDAYTGAEAELIRMEREQRRSAPPSCKDKKISRYAYYKKQRVLEYANFVANKYFSDKVTVALSEYAVDPKYFQVIFRDWTSPGEFQPLSSDENSPGATYGKAVGVISADQSENYQLNPDMIDYVAQALTDTAFYISRIREKIKLQTRKNYMKGTYDLILYVVNEFLVDYARLNPMFRSDEKLSGYSVGQLLEPLWKELSSHDVNNLTAIEYFDETEYYNIKSESDSGEHKYRYSPATVNSRFWRDPGGESLMEQDGIDRDFDLKSITSFYMDTLGIRDNYISDENSLCAFLDAVYSLGAMDSFIHTVSADPDGTANRHEMFGARVQKYGEYSDSLYDEYLAVKRAWETFTSYLSGDEYEYQVSDCVSAQVLSAAEHIRQIILDRELSSVSAVYDAYIDQVDKLSARIDVGVEAYNNLVSGEYAFYFQKQDSYKYCFDDSGVYKHRWYTSSDFDSGLEYWYDMIQSVYEYASGSDDAGNSYITNWPIRDTVEYFREEFSRLSGWYIDMTTGQAVSEIGIDLTHNWSTEYGFVDISAVSLEDELKYGYDFMTKQLADRKQLLMDMINDIKQRAVGLQTLGQSIKGQLASVLASYNDNREDNKLGDSVIYCVSLNTAHDSDTPGTPCHRAKDQPKREDDNIGLVIKEPDPVGGTVYYYYTKKNPSGEYTGNYRMLPESIDPYSSSDKVLDRCDSVQTYMDTPTSYIIGTPTNFKSMMDDGVYAAIDQIKLDWQTLSSTVDGLINQLSGIGYQFSYEGDGDVDAVIVELIEYINATLDEGILEKDPKISDYKQYLKAIIHLSSVYLPIKYEYDLIGKDQKQRAYLSEFSPDLQMTLAALDRLSAYSVEKDAANKTAILANIQQMRDAYQEALSAYRAVADSLAQEYMLPQSFQPYTGYIEEMVRLMHEALLTDVEDKTWHAHDVANEEYTAKIAPAASDLILKLAGYAASMYELPDAVSRRLKELYYLDDPAYTRQKEMFLTYGGRSFCYYPYYNHKNVVHSSYQVHPFMWNFIGRDLASNAIRRMFYSVNVDELEDANIAQNWRKFFGDFGESRYGDLSKPRYPDYSGYQSRYENSNHVAENTQFVSEVVDYDGAFYPPAVEWLRKNGLDRAVKSVLSAEYNQKFIEDIDREIYGLSSLRWDTDVYPVISSRIFQYVPAARINAVSSYVFDECYGSRPLSDVTPYKLHTAIVSALSGEDTFYGRFYKQLRLDLPQQYQNRQYIADQLNYYWAHDVAPDVPSISGITNDATLDQAYDIYKYGIDSHGNMYCLYKKYDWEVTARSVAHGGLSYRYRQSTPGCLWIRLKNHPLAFPAFSGRYPNVYMEDKNLRHIAFSNLLGLHRWDEAKQKDEDLSGTAVYTELSSSKAAFIYDFEFTKARDDVTFVTKMRTSQLTCDSPAVQCYENSWLVHCRPTEQSITDYSDNTARPALCLYSPSEETDYYRSGENHKVNPVLSSDDALDGDGVTLYQYIGSYLRGNDGIYHAYAMKHVHRISCDDVYMTADDAISSVQREALGDIKIYPQINGRYTENAAITGVLNANGRDIAGSDVCLAYDEENNILNFAAQTAPLPDASVRADIGAVNMLSNAAGPTIDDPTGGEMNSHDLFAADVTLFRMQVVSRRLKDVRGSAGGSYAFNTNADMSYFPVYPGFAGAKQLYTRPQYDHYSVELLGEAKDISEQISYVNPKPDPYLDEDSILSNFAHARVYQDYLGYIDETFKTVDNRLIGSNSDVMVNTWRTATSAPQQVVMKEKFYIWQIGLDNLYGNLSGVETEKLKVLLFNRRCCGKNPYMFIDISALSADPLDPSGGWVDLQYDRADAGVGERSVLSAPDYAFGYNNRVVAQSTLDGIQTVGVSDSNHIYNVESIQARFIAQQGAYTLEIRFNVDDVEMQDYTYVPAGLLQAVFLDVYNLDMFNYFHYLDAYGALRFINYFKTMEEFNQNLVKRGAGYTIYYAGHKFTEEELLNRLRSYYEYKERMIPLESVDLSQYDSLSDVYILQGSRRLQFKLDEEFRYELEHPGYFYPTVNAKFPMNPAQYAARTMSFRENAASDMLAGLFGQNNLFILDMEDPVATLSGMGRVDIPIAADDAECVMAYEDYVDPADGDLSSRRNCDLYDVSDPRVLQFVQFEADTAPERGVPASAAQAGEPFAIPDEDVSRIGIDGALARIAARALAEYGADGVYPVCSEATRTEYSQEYMGFTLDGGSISPEQMAELLRIYVNYRKYEDDGGPKIQLYFNYMNYMNSPYLRLQDGRPYIDIIDNTYLSLKQDEDGVLDVVVQFRYYKGGQLYGYKNVKLASYKIYNISDDKPKFIIKNVDKIERDGGSNRFVKPRVSAYVCDMRLDVTRPEGASDPMDLDVTVVVETTTPLAQIEMRIDYPSDFIEFTSSSGKGWTLDGSQPGYARLTLDPAVRVAQIPARTLHTKAEIAAMGASPAVVYIDEPVIVGQNGIVADVQLHSGHVKIYAGQITGRLDVLLTEPYSAHETTVCVFNTEYSPNEVKAFKLAVQ